MSATGKKKSSDVDDVIVVPESSLGDSEAFGRLFRAWISRAGDIADERKFKYPATATATDANGKRCFVFKLDADNDKGSGGNDVVEFNPDNVALPMLVVIEDSKGRVVKVRMQMQSQIFQ